MTIINICEEVEQIFHAGIMKDPPGRTQIIKELDKVQKEFSRDVRTLTSVGELTNIDTSISWTLPTGLLKLNEVYYFNSDNQPLYDVYLDYVIQAGKLIFFSTTSTVIENLPATISKCFILYTRVSTTVSVETDTLEIGGEYHQAFVEKILERFYMRYPTVPIEGRSGTFMGKDIPTARYHAGNYERHRLEALRHKYIDKTQRDVQYYDHAGKFKFPTYSGIVLI